MSERENSLKKPERKRLDREAYRQLMQRVFQRDRWTCRNPFCESGRNLTVHHIQKRSQLGSDEMGNLLTLCINCHEAVERHELELEVVDVVCKFHQKK